MSINLPWDQPVYKKPARKKAKKKAPARKKVRAKKKAPARKKAKKKVAKKRKVAKAKKAPARKKVKAKKKPSALDFDSLPEWQGFPKDLRKMIKLLNDLYFSKLKALGKKPLVIEEVKWGRVAVTMNGTCRYYRGGPRDGQVSIILNGQLRPDRVPTMVTAFTLFHEMVHAYCFKQAHAGNEICERHDKEFRKREKLFKGWERVMAWRKAGGLAHSACPPPFQAGMVVRPHGGRASFTVIGCRSGWLLVLGPQGDSWRIKPDQVQVQAANPKYDPILPELENDTEIMEWRQNPYVLPELEDDVEIMEWRQNPEAATKKRAKPQHKKDVQFEAIRKDVSPKLKAAEKLLTKKTSALLTEIAEGLLRRYTWTYDAYSGPIADHYVPLVANLKAGFAETKRAATAMRSRSTKQRAYDQALADYRRAAWGVVDNLLRASSLLHNPVAGPYPKKEEAFLDAWEELTEALRDAHILPINANPWHVNPVGLLLRESRS